MAYTKDTAKHDKITIDGTDVSNSFREFEFLSEDSEEDASGFSVSGVDETLPGTRAQGFTGEAFYTEELAALIFPIHDDREIVPVTYQPQGLVDATREIYTGNCTIGSFTARGTRGAVRTAPFVARIADENGITVSNWT